MRSMKIGSRSRIGSERDSGHALPRRASLSADAKQSGSERMLSLNDIKEELSYAYVHAVASKEGFACERISKDRDSVDVTIRAKGRLSNESKLMSPTLDLQLKATAEPEIVDDRIVFDLNMKNYDELRVRAPSPRLLVVLALPAEQEEWLSVDAEQLVSRRCCYWYSLRGAEEIDNESTTRIKIPASQVFSPNRLREFMVAASLPEEIHNEL